MYNKRILQLLISTIFCVIAAGEAHAQIPKIAEIPQIDYEQTCKTPPVTEHFIRDMQAYVQKAQNVIRSSSEPKLRSCGVTNKRRIFGVEILVDPFLVQQDPLKEDVLGIQSSAISRALSDTWQLLSLGFDEQFGLREFGFDVRADASYLHQRDVNKAREQLDKVRDFLLLAQVCDVNAVIRNADGSTQVGLLIDEGGQLVRLATSARARYFAYRQLYSWLIDAEHPVTQISDTGNFKNSMAPYEQGTLAQVASQVYLSLISKAMETTNAQAYRTVQQQVEAMTNEVLCPPSAVEEYCLSIPETKRPTDSFCKNYVTKQQCLQSVSPEIRREVQRSQLIEIANYQVNPFYVRDYQGTMFTECLDPSLRFHDVVNALNGTIRAGNKFGEVVQSFESGFSDLKESLDNAMRKGAKIKQDTFEALGIPQDKDPTLDNMKQAGLILRLNTAQSETSGVRSGDVLQYVKNLNAQYKAVAVSKPLQALAEGAFEGATAIEVLLRQAEANKAFDGQTTIEKKRLLETLKAEVYSNSGYPYVTYVIQQQLRLSNGEVVEMQEEAMKAAQSFSAVCARHLYRGEDCGEKPAPKVQTAQEKPEVPKSTTK